MNIIHLCPSTDFELMQYVSMMFASDEEPFITDNGDVFISLCKKSRPDIVHLHGCDSAELVKLTSKSQRQGIRTIITTHGRLDATSSVAHTHMAKEVLAHAYALVARSTMEADELKAMGVNKRIEIVSNPLVTRTTSEENLRASYKRIYQCVMESNPLELMNDATKEALHKLLKVDGACIEEEFDRMWLNADLLRPSVRNDFSKLMDLVKKTGEQYREEGIITEKKLQKALQKMTKVYREIGGTADGEKL